MLASLTTFFLLALVKLIVNRFKQRPKSSWLAASVFGIGQKRGTNGIRLTLGTHQKGRTPNTSSCIDACFVGTTQKGRTTETFSGPTIGAWFILGTDRKDRIPGVYSCIDTCVLGTTQKGRTTDILTGPTIGTS